MHRNFTKEDTQMSKKYEKSSLNIREVKIKIITSYHFTPVIAAVTKKTQDFRCWRGCREMYIDAHESGSQCNNCANSMDSLQNKNRIVI